MKHERRPRKPCPSSSQDESNSAVITGTGDAGQLGGGLTPFAIHPTERHRRDIERRGSRSRRARLERPPTLPAVPGIADCGRGTVEAELAAVNLESNDVKTEVERDTDFGEMSAYRRDASRPDDDISQADGEPTDADGSDMDVQSATRSFGCDSRANGSPEYSRSGCGT